MEAKTKRAWSIGGIVLLAATSMWLLLAYIRLWAYSEGGMGADNLAPWTVLAFAACMGLVGYVASVEWE